MIKTLRINNYQSHKNTTLEFSPGMNVIIGKTDSGKTAILRALRWIIWNRPGGDAFRSNWGGKTEIGISTGEGAEVSRIKDKAENQYILDETIFSAFGTDVPEEIQKILNITEINLQRQFDQPFLLTESPGIVATHFNKIAHIDQIDTSIKKVQSAIREIEQDITVKGKQLIQLNTDFLSFEYLEKMEMELEVLESMSTNYVQLNSTNVKVKALVTSIQDVEEEIESYSGQLEMEEDINHILTLISEEENVQKEQTEIQKLVRNVNSINQFIQTKSKIIESESLLLPIFKLWDEFNALQKERNALDLAILTIQRSQKTIRQIEYDQIQNQVLFNKEMPEICPLCEQPINTHNHEKE